MTALPAKTSISDTYPNPSNATARAGFGQLWDAISEATEKPELDLASATTCDIGGQLSTKLRITGTTTITSFGTNYRGPILLRMAGALTITHNSTTLVCPGATNITTAAGDSFIAWPKATTSGTADGWLIVKTSFSSATTSTQGVVELATDSEAQAGTDATRCVTPDNLGAVVPGMGQTWQDKTASRATGTTYPNDAGRTITLNVKGTLNTAGAFIAVAVDGTNVAFSDAVSASGVASVTGVLVQPGSLYAVSPSAGTLTSMTWMELR